MGQAIRSNAPVARPVGQAELVEAGQYDPGVPLLTTSGGGMVPMAMAVDPIKPNVQDEEQNKPKYRDTWAAFLFAAMVAVIAYYTHQFAAHGGTSGLAPTPAPATSGSHFTRDQLKAVLEVVAVAVIFSGAVSLVWLGAMIACAEKIIEFTLLGSIALYLVLGLAAFAHGPSYHTVAFVFFILAAITAMYYVCVRKRIPFAAANLKTACAAIRAHMCTVCVSFVVLVLNFAWMMMWMCAVLGVVDNAPKVCVQSIGADDDTISPNPNPNTPQCSLQPDGTCPVGCSEQYKIPYGASFGLLVAFYWGLQVFKNLSHTTTAGSVGSWWFTPDETNAVGGALRRACTWSFGSICFGSLLVAILRALEQLARSARNRDGDGGNACAACIAQCILGCLESLMEWINKWAFVYVGLYGFSFAASGRAVFKLFSDRGWTAIINDDLVENALSFAALVTGALTGAVSYGLVHGHFGDRFDSDVNQDTAAYIALGVGVLVGFAVAAVVMSVIEAAVCTVFVCFAEDPEALRRSRPDHHQRLVATWNQFHPQILQQCGFVVAQY